MALRIYSSLIRSSTGNNRPRMFSIFTRCGRNDYPQLRLRARPLSSRQHGHRLVRLYACWLATATATATTALATAPVCCAAFAARTAKTLSFLGTTTHNNCRLFSSSRQMLMTEEESHMTRDIQEMYHAAIQAVDPVQAVKNRFVHVRDSIFCVNGKHYYNLHDTNNNNGGEYDQIVLVAFGKASAAMATAVLDILSMADSTTTTTNDNNSSIRDRISGCVIVKDGHYTPQQAKTLRSFNISLREASHPIPDERSVAASMELLSLVQQHNNNNNNNNNNNQKRTLTIACISGGGSALFCAPHPRLSLQDLQDTNTFLLASGWNIQDINVIRKRLELGKGGQLALKAAFPSSGHVVSLILSDVLGDPLDLIASGPTVLDTSTWDDAWNLIQQHQERLQQQQQEQSLVPSQNSMLPRSVWELLQDGKDGKLAALLDNHHPRGHDDESASVHKFFAQNCCTCLVGNNELAVLAAAQRAQELGYTPIVLGTQIQGEAKEVAKFLVGLAQYLRQQQLQQQQTQSSSTTTTTATNQQETGHSGKTSFAMTSQFPVALIAGGETTVSLPSSSSSSSTSFQGKGGRNQELALAAAMAMHNAKLRQVVLASIGTDGTDGPTDAAGAVVDGGTIARLSQNKNNNRNTTTSSPSSISAVEALERHNAYPYLSQTDASGWSPLIKTGPTGTNVADICIVLVH